jgi:hypothetical protein
MAFFYTLQTLSARKDKFDIGIHLRNKFLALFSRNTMYYSSLSSSIPFESLAATQKPLFKDKSIPERTLPFKRIFTKNVIFTLITTAFFDFHLGAFGNLWPLLLSTPRSTTPSTLPFHFTGGLGMPSATVGLATSILGILGILLQLFLYPSVHARLGTVRAFRYFLALFPLAYFLAPYLSVLYSSTPAPQPSSGLLVWSGITFVLLLQVMARTFALPATIILLNNCSPHPSVLGTVHGMGQSVSAALRTIGPVVAGRWYGAGLENGIVGLGWWGVAGVAALGCGTALQVYEGSGHEIKLDGEEEVY